MSLLDDEQKLQDDLDKEIVNKIGNKIYNEFFLPRLLESNDKSAYNTRCILDGIIRHIDGENDILRHQISINDDLRSLLYAMYCNL